LDRFETVLALSIGLGIPAALGIVDVKSEQMFFFN